MNAAFPFFSLASPSGQWEISGWMEEWMEPILSTKQKSLEPASHVLPGGSRDLQEGSLGLLSSGLGVRVTVGGFLLEAAGPT